MAGPFFKTVALIFFLLTGLMPCCVGQLATTFTPSKTYGKEKKAIVEEARQQLRDGKALQRESSAVDGLIAKVMERSAEHFYSYYKYDYLLENDSLEQLLNAVMDRIILRNALRNHPRYLFISRSSDVNAHNYGNGVFIVTIGLVARANNVDELAFTLAHELAHDELDHVYWRVRQEVELKISQKTREQVKGILNGTIQLEDIEEFKKLIYGVSKYSRSKELSADSLGLIFYRNAGFEERNALSLLDILGHPTKPEKPVDFFEPLNDENFPIQDYWFHKRLSLYSKRPQSNFMLTSDSVQSHPDIELRKNQLSRYFTRCCPTNERFPEADRLMTSAEFEAVEASYRNGQYDLCLFHALHLLSQFPENRYLVKKVTEVFYKLYTIRTELTGYSGVQQFTAFYSDELLLLNNMLQNMSVTELREVGFHFINDPARFSVEDKDHHYLLWKLADLSNRKDIRSKVQSDYKSRFGASIKDHKVVR